MPPLNLSPTPTETQEERATRHLREQTILRERQRQLAVEQRRLEAEQRRLEVEQRRQFNDELIEQNQQLLLRQEEENKSAAERIKIRQCG